ncbi:hypothetical protein G9A89_022988 [Geosiphon pyriformis]|nr:hypothetical protein G9A89_022988 [Geosiphon pyriformis]
MEQTLPIIRTCFCQILLFFTASALALIFYFWWSKKLYSKIRIIPSNPRRMSSRKFLEPSYRIFMNSTRTSIQKRYQLELSAEIDELAKIFESHTIQEKDEMDEIVEMVKNMSTAE